MAAVTETRPGTPLAANNSGPATRSGVGSSREPLPPETHEKKILEQILELCRRLEELKPKAN